MSLETFIILNQKNNRKKEKRVESNNRNVRMKIGERPSTCRNNALCKEVKTQKKHKMAKVQHVGVLLENERDKLRR